MPKVFSLFSLLFFLSYPLTLPAEKPLDEFECLHLNIGLLALLETENTYFQRKNKQTHADDSAIGKGLIRLRERGTFCPIKPQLYIEAAEYSLHFRRLENAEYFLHKARSLTL